MNVTHLECAACGLQHEAQRLQNLCRECGKPLLVRYDLERAKRRLTKESLSWRDRTDLWRYSEVLPVESDENIVSLGEGWTPVLHARADWKRVGTGRTLHKGRVAESHSEFQSPRHDSGGLDGEGTWR